ncbi:MAG: TIGR04552 family protein [Bdellovibrionales bacterium]
MKFSFDPDILQTVAGGRSALDAKRLHILNMEAANSFLKTYGFDVNSERDLKLLWAHHRRALVLITEKLGFSESEIPENLRDPKLLQDLRLLLLYASRSSPDPLQRWSCAILRCMHVFVHADNDLFSFFAQEIQSQILIPFEKAILHDGQNIFLGGLAHRDQQVELVKFETKPFKTTSSAVIKLLARPDALAMRVFDKIGVRFVTKSLFDSFQVIRFLVQENLMSYPHIMPDQSSNNLYPVDLFLKVCERLEKSGVQDDTRVQKAFDEELAQAAGGNQLFRKPNEQSHQNFRFIKFISRQLIRISPQGNQPEFAFFYPFEVQIFDEKSYQMAMSGPSEHQAYKDRQRQAARQRLYPHDGEA